jgi:hypothetical protein
VISLLAVRCGAIEKPAQLTTVCTLAAGKLDRLDGRVRLLDVFTAPATGKATALLGTPRRTDWRLQPPGRGEPRRLTNRGLATARAGQALIRHLILVTCKARFHFTSCWEAAPLIHAGHDACFLILRSEHSERLEG